MRPSFEGSRPPVPTESFRITNWKTEQIKNIKNPFSSDGAGRSGVYLAIDANIELSEEDGVFDVFGYVKKMRQQRKGLVETLVRLCVVYERDIA